MNTGDWQKFIKVVRNEYNMIGSIPCHAFEHELVYFNKVGFNHLLRKGKDMRNRSEQTKRMFLIKDAVSILKTSTKFNTYRVHKRVTKHNSVSIAQFWSFIQVVGIKKVIVVVRQTNNGNKHFFSVM